MPADPSALRPEHREAIGRLCAQRDVYLVLGSRPRPDTGGPDTWLLPHMVWWKLHMHVLEVEDAHGRSVATPFSVWFHAQLDRACGREDDPLLRPGMGPGSDPGPLTLFAPDGSVRTVPREQLPDVLAEAMARQYLVLWNGEPCPSEDTLQRFYADLEARRPGPPEEQRRLQRDLQTHVSLATLRSGASDLEALDAWCITHLEDLEKLSATFGPAPGPPVTESEFLLERAGPGPTFRRRRPQT